MRYMIPAFAALVLATSPLVARAQTAIPPATTAPATTSATPAPVPNIVVKPARLTRMDQRFASANTSGDGHLTLDQAKAAKWTQVVRNFDKIDASGKGYVTEDDIKASMAAARAAKQAAKSTTAG
jgi:hypothetical protein